MEFERIMSYGIPDEFWRLINITFPSETICSELWGPLSYEFFINITFPIKTICSGLWGPLSYGSS